MWEVKNNDLISSQQHLKDQKEKVVQFTNQTKSLLNELENKETHRKLISQYLELHKRFDVLKTERDMLVEGQACPLCGSLEHPFQHADSNDFKDIEIKKREYEEITDQIQQLEKKLLGSKEAQNQIEIEIAKLESTLESLHSQCNDLFKRLEIEKNKHHKLIKYDFENFKDLIPLLEDSLTKLEQEKKNYLSLQTDVKEYKELQVRNTQLLSEIELLKSKIEDISKNYDLSIKELHQRKLEFKKELEAFESQKMFDYPNSEQSLNDFKVKLEELEFADQKVKNLSNQLNLKKQKVSSVETELQSLEIQLNNSKEKIIVWEDERTVLRKQRIEITSVKEIQEFIEISERKIQENSFELQKNKDLLNELGATKKQLASVKSRLELEIEELNIVINKLSLQLAEVLEKYSIPSLEDLQKSLLSKEIVQKLEAEKGALEAAIKDLETKISISQTQIEENRSKDDFGNLTLEEVESVLTEKKSIYDSYQQRLGEINQLIKTEEQNANQVTLLLESRTKQSKEFERWDHLCKVLGHKNDFRNFAQSLTLKHLIEKANSYLYNLSERYQIQYEKDGKETDLGLEIVDTYQANNVRKMATLSGGETFLVSLALALGLAELSSGNKSISSLFIDEGFGTLDATTLDIAINTLENLQSKGKLVDIISHIHEVKERIDVKFIVKKVDNGYSKIEFNHY